MMTIQRDSIITFPFLNLKLNPPASFNVFGKEIYMYGVIIGIAFLVCIWYASKHAKYVKLTEDNLYDVLVWMIPAAIIGARLYYVLFTLDYYIENPEEIIAIWEGGLAIYGGIIASAIAIILVCKMKRISSLAMMDLLITACILGQGIGRWGNFFNREAFGCVTDVFCKMGLTDTAGNTIYVHPTFLYESIWDIAGFVLLALFLKSGKRKYDGQSLLIYMVWYGFGRFFIEGLRTDSLYLGNMRISQIVSAVMVVTGAALLIINAVRKKTFKEETKTTEDIMSTEDSKALEDTISTEDTMSAEDTNISDDAKKQRRNKVRRMLNVRRLLKAGKSLKMRKTLK